MIHYMTTNGAGDAWVVTELTRVRQAGIPFVLHGMRKPTQTYFASERVAELNRDARYLYPISPVKVLFALLLGPFRFGGRYWATLFNALTGERETSRGRLAGIAHWAVACYWAGSLRREKVSHIHSQWIHSGGTIAMYGAWLLGVSFSFTGHATDLFRDRVALKDKIKRAEFIICISTFHRDFYLEQGAREDQLTIAYCGIDTAHFTPKRRQRAADQPFRIASSGRLVDKKGFEYLIEACKLLLDRGENIACIIGGSGPLEADLRERVKSLGLEDKVELTGQILKQEDLPEFMYGADAYCLPCVWAADNDVDGLPQMLMEAMACGLPAVSTRLVGIPDLVIDGETGLLVEPNDAEALADALARLMHDEALADRLAKTGRAHVEEKFDLETALTPLLERYEAKLAAARP